MKNPVFRFFPSLLISASAICLIFMITSCGQTGDPVSTGMVHNPVSASGNTDEAMPMISFNKTEHDFGQLIQGEKLSCVFRFTNTGKADLLIAKVSTSCGCTATEYPHEPIPPGGEGKIEITFDSGHQRGIQNKTITVLTNTKPSSTVLRIKAQIANPETN